MPECMYACQIWTAKIGGSGCDLECLVPRKSGQVRHPHATENGGEEGRGIKHEVRREKGRLDRKGRGLGAGIGRGPRRANERHRGPATSVVRTGIKGGLEMSFLTASEHLPPNGCLRKATSERSTHTHTHRNSQTRTRISTGTQRLTQALADRHALAHRDTRTDTRRHTRCSSTAPQHCPACSSARAWLPGYKERG